MKEMVNTYKNWFANLNISHLEDLVDGKTTTTDIQEIVYPHIWTLNQLSDCQLLKDFFTVWLVK